MPKHEAKICGRCQTEFECKVGSIDLCQCTAIQLSVEENDYIKTKYGDCLCISCLHFLQAEYHNTKIKRQIKKLLR